LGLQEGLIDETPLPFIQGWLNSMKDEVIPLFPNKPGPKEKKVAEEIIGALMFSLLHHGLEI
jgi:hypothetical protein